MAKVISNLDDCIEYINSIYEADSSAPTSGDEDFTVWTSILNIAVNLWENETGMLWKELFVKLSDATTGDKTTTTARSYDVPDDFRFPASGIVWIGSGSTKTAYKVINIEDLTLYENNSDNWCYFVLGGTPSLEFNPNCSLASGATINYAYYKNATKLSTGTDELEMSDPMFAVFYALSELRRDEGDASSGQIATQKLEAMKTKNTLPTWHQEYSLLNNTSDGFGV